MRTIAFTSIAGLTFFTTIIKLIKSQATPVMLIELNRHGARAPLSELTDVIKLPWIENAGRGELTPVGQRQRFYLGKNMFYRYPEIFKNGLNNSETYTRSTDVNRTIMSGISQTFGVRNGTMEITDIPLIFDNDDERVLPPQELLFDPKTIDFKTPLINGYRPIAIFSEPEDQDLMLASDGYTFSCPTNMDIYNKSYGEMDEELKKNENMLNLIEEALKIYGIEEETKDWERNFGLCYNLGDFVLQDYFNNPDPKIKKTDEVFKRLADCYYLGISSLVAYDNIAKSASTPLLNEIVDYFNTKIESFDGQNFNYSSKYIQFSAHDDTLSAHLTALNMLNYTCLLNQVKEGKDLGCKESPPLASSFVWELLKIENQEKTKLFEKQNDVNFGVRVSYNGEYVNYCGQSDPEKTNYICPFGDFKALIKDKMTVPDIEDYCGLVGGKNVNKDDELIFIILGCVLIGFNLTVVIGIFVVKKRIKGFNVEQGSKGINDGDYIPAKDEEE